MEKILYIDEHQIVYIYGGVCVYLKSHYWVMEEILYIDEHQIVYKWRCLSILICWIEHDNDFFFVIVYLYQRPLELSWFSLWVATRECTLQSWSPKSVVAFQRLDSSARCRSGNGTEGLIKILQCDTSTKLRLGHSTLC